MEEANSKFNINFVREVFLVGDEVQAAAIRKALKGYYYLAPRTAPEPGCYSEEAHFVVAIADFTSAVNMQAVARMFAAAEAPNACKIVYVTAPDAVTREQLLFAQEVGARFVCVGPKRSEELRDYLKRVCTEAHQLGSLDAFEQEIEQGRRAHDLGLIKRAVEKLKALPSESEDSLRLLALAAHYLSDNKRAEAYLRRLLSINPQNLWAANTLGKFYLRTGNVAQGMEILQKLSSFHELNSERLLTLGNAQVVAGKTQEAEASLRKGQELSGGTDPRFSEGLAKVKLAQKDLAGALDCLNTKEFSEDMLSFLNMRAIMAIRGGKLEEGIDYYGYALKGAGQDRDVKAKLLFNMGLAYVRTNDLEKARTYLKESCELGGPRFQRAKGPLETVTTVLKNRDKAKKNPEAIKVEESEWETLF